MILEVHPGPDEVERVGDDAAGSIGPEGGEGGDDCQVNGALGGGLSRTPLVEAEHERELALEQIIDGVEDPREGHVANQGNFQPSEKSARALLLQDLAEGVHHARILREAHHLEPSLHHDEWVRDYRLESSGGGTRQEVDLALLKHSRAADESFCVVEHAKVAASIESVLQNARREAPHEASHTFLAVDELCCLSCRQTQRLLALGCAALGAFFGRTECLLQVLLLVLHTDLH